MKNIEKLDGLKETLEERKAERGELTGRYKALLESIKTEFGVAKKEDAEKKINQLNSEITKIEASIKIDLEALLTKYGIEIDEE